jgi:molecular chaperone HtpG
LVVRLNGESDESRFKDLAELLFDQAVLSEGAQLEDPAAFVKRVNALLTSALG